MASFHCLESRSARGFARWSLLPLALIALQGLHCHRRPVAHRGHPPTVRAASAIGSYQLTHVGGAAAPVPTVTTVLGDADQPRPGDLATIWGQTFVLGEPGEYRIDCPAKSSVCFRLGPGKTKTVHSVSSSKGDKKKPAWQRLSDAERLQLRVVRVEGAPTPELRDALERLPTASYCLDLRLDEATPSSLLPKNVKCLFLQGRGAGAEEVPALDGLRDLEYLKLTGFRSIDFARLGEHPRLSYLSVEARPDTKASRFEGLGVLSNLRVLHLSGLESLGDLAFAKTLSSLRSLDVSGSNVRSLAPLAGLSQLAQITAHHTPLRELSRQPMPALRTLRALVTELPERELTRFRAANPKARVDTTWNGSLRNTLAGAAEVRVRTMGAQLRDARAEQTLAVIRGADIKELVELLQVQEDKGVDGHGPGGPTFEFLADGKLLASVELQQGSSLGWTTGWPRAGALEPEKAQRLLHWLTTRTANHPAIDGAGSVKPIDHPAAASAEPPPARPSVTSTPAASVPTAPVPEPASPSASTPPPKPSASPSASVPLAKPSAAPSAAPSTSAPPPPKPAVAPPRRPKGGTTTPSPRPNLKSW